MLLIDGNGLPLAVNIHSASPAEVTLIEPLLDRHVLGEHSIRLIYDRAADSDPLRERLATDGIELICPHRKGRKRPPTQDGRSLKRYRSRWKMERTIAWLQSYRRLVVRYEVDPRRFLAFAQLACLHKVLKRLKPL
jgi:transposase